MKKIIYALALICIFSLRASAQEYTKPQLTYKVHPGTVTTLTGEILKGYVINRDNTENQNQCIYYGDYTDSRSKQVFGPSDIKGYTVENNEYKSIPYSGNMGFGKPGKHFLYITQPGAITTYTYYAPIEQLVWQKGDEEPVSNASMFMGFKKNMLKLVGGDAELAAKIENKEKGYGMLNIAQIVNEYNTWAKAAVAK